MNTRSRGQSERIERERHFYNRSKESSYELLRGRIERAIGSFARYEDMRDLYDPSGKEVLDYGCGNGSGSIELLKRGARHVTGIDISEVQTDEARRRVAAAGYADRASFSAADAHATGFEDDAFDLIVGAGILHHLELEPALRELHRILRPGGQAVLLEPLMHNPLLKLGRALTPAARTPDEHPITVSDWALCASVFPRFRHQERELLTIPLMPLNLVLPERARDGLAARVSRLDDRVLARYPSLGKYARITFMEFYK